MAEHQDWITEDPGRGNGWPSAYVLISSGLRSPSGWAGASGGQECGRFVRAGAVRLRKEHNGMEKMVKYIADRVYEPLLTRYLSATRHYSCKGFHLVIPPGVFHPGFFFSTRLLLSYIAGQDLRGHSFLELGAGSGLISLYAAREGARVIATDINPVAIECIRANRRDNRGHFSVLQSDLFDEIPPQAFDLIAINPPYYKKIPRTPGEYAWYCGENGEYFERLFGSLGEYSHARSGIFMILCDGCDLEMIQSMATRNGFGMKCVFKKKNLVETNFIFSIGPLEG